jgi:hypothetical protein
MKRREEGKGTTEKKKPTSHGVSANARKRKRRGGKEDVV